MNALDEAVGGIVNVDLAEVAVRLNGSCREGEQRKQKRIFHGFHDHCIIRRSSLAWGELGKSLMKVSAYSRVPPASGTSEDVRTRL